MKNRSTPFLTGVLCLIASFLCECAARELQAGELPDKVRNFRECVAAGYPVRKTMPGSCATPDGRVFFDIIEEGSVVPPSGRLCVDQCGNGICEMIVCQGSGCPCGESPDRCPSDCK